MRRAEQRPADRARLGFHHARRGFQLFFLGLFFALLTLTVWPLGSVFLGAFLSADPLIALNSALNGSWPAPAWLAVGLLALPLVAGRAFCGYVCPLGTMVERLTPSTGPSSLREAARERLRRAPLLILLGSGGLALFGSGAHLLLDPLAILTRTATVLVYPLLDRILRLTGDIAYLAPPLRNGVDVVTSVLAGRLIFTRPLVYGLAPAALLMFASVLGLSWLEPRLWCRHLCPLGALLGVVGRAQVVGRAVDPGACIHCGRCVDACPMDAVAEGHLATDVSRCQACYACADVCPTDAIGIGWRPARIADVPGRRDALVAGGIALLVGFFTYTGLARRARDPRLIRPPGAAPEEELLALCARCGQCMKVCPTNVLQPAVARAGLEGVFTPVMDYRIGECEWSCNECGKVCPTGAIRPLTLTAKRATAIGRAYIDRDRCIPWVDHKTCLVCQELCPVPDKAIRIVDGKVASQKDGDGVVVGRPEVVPERCIGCGVCEHVCPVPARPAIEVHAVDRGRPV